MFLDCKPAFLGGVITAKGRVMIFQLHWQNAKDLNRTIFVLQGDTDEIESDPNVKAVEWIAEQFQNRRESMPEGWHPLVCWGGHPAMMLQPVSVAPESG